MRPMRFFRRFFWWCALYSILTLAGNALAEKPSWAGGEKHDATHERNKHDNSEQRRGDDDRNAELRINAGGIEIRIAENERRMILDFYQDQLRAGHCPPGLAKKQGKCTPPGQLRKWSRGKVLPAGVAYHPLPNDLSVRLPAPPAGHRYVQVAADILLIAVGSSMVVDAIEDLVR